jgi:tetratricopeptide (TPR) repeat protein
MAKIKPAPKSSGAKKKRRVRSDQETHHRADGTVATKQKLETPEQLYFKASEYFLQLQVDRALPIAKRALERYQDVYPEDPTAPYPALLLLGQIYLAHGEVDLSREHYLKATELDPEGRKTGAAPFLWSAQLSEEGGEDSITWFEKACTILRRELKGLEEKYGIEEAEDEILKTRRELGEALCSMTEVYMTDLSYGTISQLISFDADCCFLQP